MEENNELKKRYEIKPQKKRHPLFIVGIITLVVVSLFIGTFLGASLVSGRFITTDLEFDEKSALIRSYMEEYWLYGDEYEDLDTTLRDNSYYGMTGFIEDPYTTYQSASELEEFSSSINMNFVGIGVTYTVENGQPTIIKVYNDSPASKAGLEPGDIIESVDGTNVVGMTSDEIKELVVGEEGTITALGIKRQGEHLNIEVTRGKVESTVYGYEYEGIPVLELISFGETSYDECVNFLNGYKDADKLIIDLRDNTGGYQSAVLGIAGLFLDEDSLVMRAVYKDGHEELSYETADVRFENFKEIAILTNGETASAAEVLVMALKEGHPDAYTVGDTTYGKGVMQSTFTFSDGSALKITTARWLSPEGKWINEVGIAPDYPVSLHDALYQAYPHFSEDESFTLDDAGQYIELMEMALDYLDYDVERQDGYFDESFLNALNAYKSEHGFKADGILDKTTYETIISSVTKVKGIDKSKDTQLNEAIKIIKEGAA